MTLLQAGELGGLEEVPAGESEADAEGGGSSAAKGGRRGTSSRRLGAAQAAASSYLVCCVEEPAAAGGAHAVEVGLAAVEPSTGAVLHATFR